MLRDDTMGGDARKWSEVELDYYRGQVRRLLCERAALACSTRATARRWTTSASLRLDVALAALDTHGFSASATGGER